MVCFLEFLEFQTLQKNLICALHRSHYKTNKWCIVGIVLQVFVQRNPTIESILTRCSGLVTSRHRRTKSMDHHSH